MSKVTKSVLPVPENFNFVAVNEEGFYAMYVPHDNWHLSVTDNIKEASVFCFDAKNDNLDLRKTMLDRVVKEYVPIALYSVRHLMNDKTFTLKQV